MYSLAACGDVDGDGVADLAVGAPGTRDSSCPNEGDICLHGGGRTGAVWILFLTREGTVYSFLAILPSFLRMFLP